MARAVLARAGQGAVTLIDIDADPALAGRYGDRVPVARIGDAELDWPFTAADVRRAVDASGGNGARR